MERRTEKEKERKGQRKITSNERLQFSNFSMMFLKLLSQILTKLFNYITTFLSVHLAFILILKFLITRFV